MDFSNLSHNDFIKHISAYCGSERAWREFYNRYHKAICAAIARRFAGTKFYQDLEDISQDVYLILRKDNCKALINFKGQYENAIFSYLKMIAVHAAIRHMKNNSAETLSDEMGKLLQGLGEVAEDPLKLSELKEEIEDCLDKIVKPSRHPERDKNIFRLRFYDDLTPEDIADFIKEIHKELAPKRVWGILGEMRKSMGDCLGGKFGGE